MSEELKKSRSERDALDFFLSSFRLDYLSKLHYETFVFLGGVEWLI